MNYARIIPYDIANGEGVRISLFVSGCNLHCEGCFNKEAQNFLYGKEYTEETEEYILSIASKPECSGLSILGGEPFDQEDSILDLISLMEKIKLLGKTVWVWTGHTWEEIARYKNLLEHCDVLVDGPFIQKLANPTLAFRGSSNQRIIDVQKSLKENKIIIYKE